MHRITKDKKQFQSQKPLLVFVAIAAVYLFTRLYNLTLFPIFTDEAIYIYWAKFIAEHQSNYFISLTDGKPPLLIWAIAGLLKVFPQQWYLLAGRIPSVIAGLVSLAGIYAVADYLFDRRTAVVASILYILLPFTLFYDRLALFDSLLNSMLVWSVYFMLRTARTHRVSDAVWWGVFLGLGFLSKAPALLFWLLTPVAAFLLQTTWRKQELLRLTKRTVLALGIGQVLNNALRISSVYHLMGLKNQQFQRGLAEIVFDPIGPTLGNLNGFFSWLWSYFTAPLLVLGIVAIMGVVLIRRTTGLVFALLWLAPIVAFSAGANIIFPRYIVFTTPYVLIPIAAAAVYVARNFPRYRVLVWLSGGIIAGLLVYVDSRILTNPPQAPLPATDYKQYISEHPSGYGLAEVFAYLNEHSQNEQIVVVTEGTFGVFPYALNLEYWHDDNIIIFPVFPFTVTSEMRDLQRNHEVFVLFKDQEQFPVQFPVEHVLTAEKPNSTMPIFLARLKPE